MEVKREEIRNFNIMPDNFMKSIQLTLMKLGKGEKLPDPEMDQSRMSFSSVSTKPTLILEDFEETKIMFTLKPVQAISKDISISEEAN